MYLEYFVVQYFSINFHFLNNDKSYNRDYFTTNAMDDGLSNQRDRPARDSFHLKEHSKLRGIVFSKVCDLELQ